MMEHCCHSGLEPESSFFPLDSRFRGNDTLIYGVLFHNSDIKKERV
jgi:hypothetical protein